MKRLKQLGVLASSLVGFYLALPIAQTLAEPTLEEKLASAQVAADTAWMLISTALVLLMTPGLAFFYGGFVAKRNILNTLMMSFVMMGIIGTTWVLWG